MIGLDIARRAYARLRRPSQQALPQKLVLDTVAEVVARRKVDLVMSIQNSEAITSPWFIPNDTDFPLSAIGLSNMLVPRDIEMRPRDSDDAMGVPIPIVNHEVLNTSVVGAAAFYGNPSRLVFSRDLDYLQENEFRIIYEPDAGLTMALGTSVGLPNAFRGYVSLEVAWRLLDQVEDTSPEWMQFMDLAMKMWPAQLVDEAEAWDKYVREFKGRAQVPKRTFFQNRSAATTREQPRFQSVEDVDRWSGVGW